MMNRMQFMSFLVTLLVGSIVFVQLSSPANSATLRQSHGKNRRLQEEQEIIKVVEHESSSSSPVISVGMNAGSIVPDIEFDTETQALLKLHESLCTDDTARYPPLNYENCPPDAVLNVIPLFGGMTNALKMILLGGILSFEENRCFYIDEDKAHLNPMKNGKREGFMHKYFEPIGLSKDHPYVIKAFAEGRVQTREWTEYWNDMDLRRIYSKMYTIPALGYANIEGHQLKKVVLRRMWKLLPEYRTSTCKTLTEMNLGHEYMSFSVRRGDKALEKFAFTKLSDYIYTAESHVHRFGGKMPKIFVASDDCGVMTAFREMRPEWTFVSQCDAQRHDQGFALSDVQKWGNDEEAAHFRKFFVEMYAMTLSKVLIGVAYTNVSWWVYFMRPFRNSFYLLDKSKGQTDFHILNMW